MCGFAGVTWWRGAAPTGVEARVARMVASIRHRGPDSDGLIAADFAHVAFKRLSIIDLATGDQPVASEDGTVQVLFNGEIYNHDVLRRELEARGHRFRTKGDSEIIPHLYQEYGLDFVGRLNGMFAICIVDLAQRRTLLYRDRLGIKPLYYAQVGDALVFGSELKTIVASEMVEPDVDPDRLLTFLGNFCSPGRSTLLRGIEKLLPGERVLIDEATGPRWDRYYQVPVTPADAA